MSMVASAWPSSNRFARNETLPLRGPKQALCRMTKDQCMDEEAPSASIENARLRRELAMALERQAATAEILNVIARSPTDVQPVFDVISGSAQRLLGGQSALVTRVVDDMLYLAACTAGSPDGDEEIRVSFPAALTARGIH